jgi:hypothetical protein
MWYTCIDAGWDSGSLVAGKRKPEGLSDLCGDGATLWIGLFSELFDL